MTRRNATIVAVAVAAASAIVLGLLSSQRDAPNSTTTSAADPPLGRPIGGNRSTSRRAAANPAAAAAARTFFRSYLAVSYGRAQPAELRNATASLRQGLRAQNPRVPPGVRRLTPRLASLRLEPVADGRLRATATVDDGDVAAYPLFATLARRHGRWVAVSVGG